MPDKSIPDYLKVEQLYGRAETYVNGVAETGDHNPDELRRRLDPVHIMGKAIGRRSALDQLGYPTELDDLRKFLKEVRRVADGSPIRDLRALVDVFDKHDRDQRREHRGGFEDPLINGWLTIIDSNVPRETSQSDG